ncbi:GNAT family N-acetyltransferase/peptidase C39 family protein [Neptunomonas antarctica]|uniref:Ribosomal protein S18 acetylase RimI n=1 Tax=Neptunomonas antarctica TaxID=619304 RepID=A0A1N7J5F2_9GAMM|nr:GNAT family N-acetyltransferase/peptidase C39 family protein [Neptunomonas antarctica]SIS44451.1 Ribosomal protein S18 acetylase RimI [Neptunomonas antarctica]
MSELSIRQAIGADLSALLELEQACFSGDRISKRRFQHWLKATNCVFLVAEDSQGLVGYGLVLLHKGTRLSRLYSLAVASRGRHHGVARQLMQQLEEDTSARGRLYMRLEVAKSNTGAIRLYESLGYICFDEYSDYYEDHTDALRMQKRIRFMQSVQAYKPTPWYQQTTEFSCGPAALMMAMASLDKQVTLSQGLELDIWREATTIFMTSGLGGCHPLGLALAAQRRGFTATAYISSRNPLFIEGVRSEHKKSVMTEVDKQFHVKAEAEGVETIYADVTQNQIQAWLTEGFAVLVLISTYRMDGLKAPHWVTVTAVDDICLYVHDPDPDDKHQLPIDCQHIPIARENFAKMSAFGNKRLRTAVVIRK